jgi:phenylalanyl-tRNA synthetase alpha chain
MLHEKIKQYTEEIRAFQAKNVEELEQFRLKFLVNKGIVKALFEEFKTVSAEEKRTLGKVLNEFKQLAEQTFKNAQDSLGSQSTATANRGEKAN